MQKGQLIAEVTEGNGTSEWVVEAACASNAHMHVRMWSHCVVAGRVACKCLNSMHAVLASPKLHRRI